MFKILQLDVKIGSTLMKKVQCFRCLQGFQHQRFFKHPDLKILIIGSQKRELLAVGIINIFSNEVRDDSMLLPYFKNLIYYVHQANLIIVMLLMLLLKDKKNQWLEKLQISIETRAIRRIIKRKELGQTLKLFNENILGVMKNIQKQLPKKVYIVEGLNYIINNEDYIEVERMRELVNNFILYKEGGGITLPLLPKQISTKTKEIDALKSPAHASHAFYDDLPRVFAPFLPPCDDQEYCLVLDLDETLVHYFDLGQDSHFLVRPGCTEFLTEMAKYYEVVIFTAAMQDVSQFTQYADSVLDQIDPEGLIAHRMYRQHTMANGNVIVKDLSQIGRDLKKTIIVDNVSDNFILQMDNGIFIKTWYEDMSDTVLFELIPLLADLVKRNVPDVRQSLRFFRDQMTRALARGVANPLAQFKGQ